MSWFFEVVPYLLVGGTIALGAFEIIRNWHEYKTARLKISVAGVFIVVAVLTLVSLWHDGTEKRKSRQGAEEQMSALRAQAATANQAQKENTKLFVESFGKMSGQMGDLKAEVKTEKLQKKLAETQAEMAAVQAELLKTQKALAPGPKAELAFSFSPFVDPPPPAEPILSKEVMATMNSDGSVHVDFEVLNSSEVDAKDVELDLHICDACKFSKEPGDFRRLPGMADKERYLLLPNLHAMSGYRAASGVDFIPPPKVKRVKIGFVYRCSTCVLTRGATDATFGTVVISRTGLLTR